MIIVPHILVGAAIGAQIRHFGWIIVLGLLSHFILDKIPHWDYGDDVFKKFSKNKSYKILFIFMLQIMIDALIGLVIVFLIIWQKNTMNLNNLQFILVGILASTLPDIILGTIKLFGLESKNLSKKYIHFHEDICHSRKGHIKKPTLFGVGTEIIVGIIAILILLI